MRPYLILFLVGIVLAAVAALAVRNTAPPPEPEKPVITAAPSSRILVAQEKISTGSFIRADKSLAWADWPADKVKSPPFIMESGTKLESFNGAVARREIQIGEPVTSGMLLKAGEGGFMAAVLNPKMRAVSVAVDATSGNAGFIFPGDKVDAIVTHAIPAQVGGDIHVSETFVENVRVLAVDQMLDNPENKAVLAKTVTLEVTPRQAEAVNVAAQMGKISLSLRSIATEEVASGHNETPAALSSEQDGAAGGADGGLSALYPPEPIPASLPAGAYPPSSYTRDSDISKLISPNMDTGRVKVRLMRGKEATEIEFQK